MLKLYRIYVQNQISRRGRAWRAPPEASVKPIPLSLTDTQGSQGSMDSYKKWIQRVGVNEYADELIVAAVAAELELRIVCVPYTPQDSATKWKISTYCSTNERGTIFLGNNDVHYMLLLPDIE